MKLFKNSDRNSSSVVPLLFGLTTFTLALLLFSGCGETPSGPPEVEMGSIEIYAYYDSTWVDSVGNQHDTWLAPTVIYRVDNFQMKMDSVPALVENLYPGTHKVYAEYGDYNTTCIVDVNPGEVTVATPVMTQFAPDFNEPGVRFDIVGDSMVHTDSIKLQEHLGEVVLLFYFGATWGECIGREIPEIDSEINQYFNPDSVEVLGVADNNTPLPFLENYVQGNVIVNPNKITFNLLYDAPDMIEAYSFVFHSTWVVIDQEGRVVYREDNNTEEIMIDIVKEKIEELLNQ